MKNILNVIILALLPEEEAMLRYMRNNPNFREDPSYPGKRFYFSAHRVPLGVFYYNEKQGNWKWVILDKSDVDSNICQISTLKDLRSLTCKNDKR